MGIACPILNGDRYPDYFLTRTADNKLQTLTTPPSGTGPIPRIHFGLPSMTDAEVRITWPDGSKSGQ